MGARDGVGQILAFPLLAANHISWRNPRRGGSRFLRDLWATAGQTVLCFKKLCLCRFHGKPIEAPNSSF